MPSRQLALDFVGTVRAGRSGLIDQLADVDAMTAWVRERAGALDVDPGFTATEDARQETVRLRQAVRSLFARAVSPEPPSRADAARLPGFAESLDLVNAAVLAAPRSPQLAWPDGPEPRTAPFPGADDATRLRAALATAAVRFLTGPDLPQLRTCQAPRCVLYFAKDHPRQEWCSTACGNRARAARHYREHKKHQGAQETHPL
ncbi:CGNR zinc finger domain-containing protein [Nonomuraea pusilla]|uniref:CGNR zinc finger domain-containing protein n=1 Tax=Nonomuraea pusilla TaxID=46177 RepID=UPI0033308BC0